MYCLEIHIHVIKTLYEKKGTIQFTILITSMEKEEETVDREFLR